MRIVPLIAALVTLTSCGWLERTTGLGGDETHVDRYTEPSLQPRAAPQQDATAPKAELAPPVTLKDGQFVGPDGQVQPLHGFNYFGFNTDLGGVHGLWNPADPMLDFQRVVYRQKLLGFNAVRLPFSFAEFPKEPKNFEADCPDLDDLEVVKATISPDAKDVDPTKAPKLAFQIPRRPGKCNSLETTTTRARYLQAVEMYVKNGFYVLLDNHYREDRLAETDQRNWLEGWKQLAQELLSKEEYQGRIFFDLLNEPGQYGQRWEKNDKAGIQELYLAAMDAVWSVSDKAIFFIEGTGQEGMGANWGDGYCSDPSKIQQQGLSDPRPFFQSLKTKPYANAVALAPHCYGPKVTFATKDFSGPDLYTRLSASFGSFNTASGPADLQGVRLPVAVGEFGSHFNDDSDVHFMQDFAAYLSNQGEAKDGKHDPIPAWFYWCWNNDSGDTGGLVQDNWKDIEWVKISYLQTLGLTPWYKAKDKPTATALPRPPDPTATAQPQGPATPPTSSILSPTTSPASGGEPSATTAPAPSPPAQPATNPSPATPTAPQPAPPATATTKSEPSPSASSTGPSSGQALPSGQAPASQAADKPPTTAQMLAGWGKSLAGIEAAKPSSSPSSASPGTPQHQPTTPPATPPAATTASTGQTPPAAPQGPSPAPQQGSPSTPPPQAKPSGPTSPTNPSSPIQIPKIDLPPLTPIRTDGAASPAGPSRPGTPPATKGPVVLTSTPPAADGKIHATIHLDSSWEADDKGHYFAYQLHLVNMGAQAIQPPYDIAVGGPVFTTLWQSWNIDEASCRDGMVVGKVTASWAALQPEGKSDLVMGLVARADDASGEIHFIRIGNQDVVIDPGH